MLSCDYDKDCPFRPVDWRWRQAAYLLRHKWPVDRRCGDLWVQRALNYQFARKGCRSKQELETLGTLYPEFVVSCDIWSDQFTLRRPTIEAAILARESDTVVARRLGLSANVVEVYEALFFNVRERLPYTGYIMAQAIGPKVHTSLTLDDFDLFMKLFAYHCGPGMIDVLLEYASFVNTPGGHTGVDDVFTQQKTRDMLTIKAAMASLTLETAPKKSIKIMKEYLAVLRIEAKMKSSGANNKALEEGLAVSLGKFGKVFGWGSIPGPAVEPATPTDAAGKSPLTGIGETAPVLGVRAEPERPAEKMRPAINFPPRAVFAKRSARMHEKETPDPQAPDVSSPQRKARTTSAKQPDVWAQLDKITAANVCDINLSQEFRRLRQQVAERNKADPLGFAKEVVEHGFGFVAYMAMRTEYYLRTRLAAYDDQARQRPNTGMPEEVTETLMPALRDLYSQLSEMGLAQARLARQVELTRAKRLENDLTELLRPERGTNRQPAAEKPRPASKLNGKHVVTAEEFKPVNRVASVLSK